MNSFFKCLPFQKNYILVTVSSSINQLKFVGRTKDISGNVHTTPLHEQIRKYSNNFSKPPNCEKRLTSLPRYIWPGFIKWSKNLVFTNFILKMIDEKFDIAQFTGGSLQLIQSVSGHISRCEFGELNKHVTSQTIKEIEKNIQQFNKQEILDFRTRKNEIVIGYPYEIGAVKRGPNIKGFDVEVAMVYWVLKDHGLDELLIKRLIQGRYETFKYDVRILNYRFRRVFAGPASGEWMINGLNHFKPFVYTN